jgi:hypothetical protein
MIFKSSSVRREGEIGERRCANFAWYLLEEEDKYIPIISDIQYILRRL